MIKLWNLLVRGHHCEHKWEILEKGNIEGNKPGTIGGRFFNLRCTKCGDLKVRNLR